MSSNSSDDAPKRHKSKKSRKKQSSRSRRRGFESDEDQGVEMTVRRENRLSRSRERRKKKKTRSDSYSSDDGESSRTGRDKDSPPGESSPLVGRARRKRSQKQRRSSGDGKSFGRLQKRDEDEAGSGSSDQDPLLSNDGETVGGRTSGDGEVMNEETSSTQREGFRRGRFNIFRKKGREEDTPQDSNDRDTQKVPWWRSKRRKQGDDLEDSAPKKQTLGFTPRRIQHPCPGCANKLNGCAFKAQQTCGRFLSFLGVGIRRQPQISTLNSATKVDLKFDGPQVLCVRVFKTTKLEDDPLVVHPIVRMHVVDICTGQYLRKNDINKSAVHYYEYATRIRLPRKKEAGTEDTDNQISAGLRQSMQVEHILPMASQLGKKDKVHGNYTYEESFVFNEDYEMFLGPNVLFLFEILEIVPGAPTPKISHDPGWYRVAWAFLRPIGKNGRVNANENPDRPKEMRLQLYRYKNLSSLVRFQISGLQIKYSNPSIPFVYYEWLRASYSQYNGSIFVMVTGQQPPEEVVVRDRRPILATEEEAHKKRFEDLELDTAWSGQHVDDVEEQMDSVRLKALRRKRNMNEDCLLPNTLLHKIHCGSKGCNLLSFSPDGQWLAAAIIDDGLYYIVLYDVDTAFPVLECKGHFALVHDICWSKDSCNLFSSSADGTSKLWLVNQRIEQGDGGSEGTEGGATGSPRTSGAPKAHHDESGPGLVLTMVHKPPCYVFAGQFYPRSDGGVPNVAITGAFDHKLRLWDVQTGECLGIIFQGGEHGSFVNAITFDARKSRMFSGDAQGFVFVWRVKSPANRIGDYQMIRRIRHPDLMGRPIVCLQIHPSRSQLLVQARQSSLKLFELRSFQPVHRGFAGAQCNEITIRSCFSPDGKYVLSGSEDGKACSWDSQSSQRLRTQAWNYGYGEALVSVSWSSTEHCVALSSYGQDSPILVLAHERTERQAAIASEEAKSAATSAELARSQEDLLRLEKIREGVDEKRRQFVDKFGSRVDVQV